MKEQNEKLRTTIYIDEELVKRAEILFGEAKVNSFSAFASKAIEAYITKLVINKNGDLLSDEIRKAIKNELGPINTRVSKGLYPKSYPPTSRIKKTHATENIRSAKALQSLIGVGPHEG